MQLTKQAQPTHIHTDTLTFLIICPLDQKKMWLSHNTCYVPLLINSVFFTNDTAVTEGWSVYVCLCVAYRPHQASLASNASLIRVCE